jgi:hypothetical protein
MAGARCASCGSPLSSEGAFCSSCGVRGVDPLSSHPRTTGAPPSPPSIPWPGASRSTRSNSTPIGLALFVVLAVIGVTVLGTVYYVGSEYRFCHGCGGGNTPIGSAFQSGSPSEGKCPAASTFSADGCLGSTHFRYLIAIPASTIGFGDGSFLVQTSSGAIDVASGALGFTILTVDGSVAAQYGVTDGQLSMSHGWTFGPGISAGTPLTNAYFIVIDMGLSNPSGHGLEFVVHGTGSYTGATAPLLLP